MVTSVILETAQRQKLSPSRIDSVSSVAMSKNVSTSSRAIVSPRAFVRGREKGYFVKTSIVVRTNR